ncbi:MAG: HDOD domain-containing protein [Fimbriimonadaceae bacterium]|nr:MAG: putative signal transduction protein [Armatimonadetes bacterium OLB18]WKZ80277.1 MAG: HDOD domain-containing protein [Fimbriimonadaceae bacterium]
MALDDVAVKIARSENLSILPEVGRQVIRLIDDPDASVAKLESLIERDPAMSAKIVRVANSAYYGHSNIGSIGRAVTVLGMNIVRSLVTTIVYQQVVKDYDGFSKGFAYGLWRHSVATGIVARILAKIKMPLKAENLYAASLIHNVGLLSMGRFCSDQLVTVIAEARKGERSILEVEHEQLGFDHTEVGELIGQKWGLPEFMITALRYHHSPLEAPANQETATIVAVSQLAAQRAGYTFEFVATPEPIPTEWLEAIELSEDQIPAVESVLHSEMEKVQQLFNVPAAA